jgi:ribosomal protein S18 acetylase RimI-like enzyme
MKQPISDYSFANVFIWDRALGLSWAILHHHLCVFANGEDLTLLLPPMPMADGSERDLRRAVLDAFDIMDGYNLVQTGRQRSRIEYVSGEMLEAMHAAVGRRLPLTTSPMSGDYIYPRCSMVDLAGGGLKSKRHARSRFMRCFPDHRAADLEAAHIPACLDLLDHWHAAVEVRHVGQTTEDASHIGTDQLRHREEMACRLALKTYGELGLRGMTLWVGDQLAGFTLGEALSPVQCSILIEKTDPAFEGAPQMIFSEFCRLYWPDHPEINVGDDWGIPSLRATKESYRPSRRLNKYVLSRPSPVTASWFGPMGSSVTTGLTDEADRSLPLPSAGGAQVGGDGVVFRPAAVSEADALTRLEQACFNGHDAFNLRQVRRLLRSHHAVCLLAEHGGRVLGWCVALVRQHRGGVTGRVYSLAVDPAMRGCSLGRRLLSRVVQALRRCGVRSVYLEVRVDNVAAIGLYQRMGFVSVRPLPDYYAEGSDGLSMRLNLVPGGREQAIESAVAGAGWPLYNNSAFECTVPVTPTGV